MHVGTIKLISPRGFGFIQIDSGPDVFFSYAAVEEKAFEAFAPGERVEYELAPQSAKGPRALVVRPVAQQRMAA
ncbi:MAG TPA: cold shock domain-containing protein [Pirellulales bacterium]|nr:cold shock domain-containing protein [Pirellulales bacterium]